MDETFLFTSESVGDGHPGTRTSGTVSGNQTYMLVVLLCFFLYIGIRCFM